MISYIELWNFKSFSHVFFDLRGSHGKPKKFAFLYGENGSGKSNLIGSLRFICQSTDTLNNQQELQGLDFSNIEFFKNEKLRDKIVSELVKTRLYSLQYIIRQNRSIGERAPMAIKVGFYYKGKEGFYFVKFNTEKDSESIIEERLYYTLNERVGPLFSISANDKNHIFVSPTCFLDAKYRYELLDMIDKYWGKHTFISILKNEMKTKNNQYFNSRIAPNLLYVLGLFGNISTLYKDSKSELGRIALPFELLHNLDQGNIENQNDSKLLAMQDFLNDFFTQLYSDIKHAYYRFESTEHGYHYELFFDKICGDKLISVPVSLESTGTTKILNLLPFIFISHLGAPVFIDEVDSGIHDLLMQDIVRILQSSLEQNEEGQFITTTHNTLLLDVLEPENVYVLKTDIVGNKEISCITDYPRTHKNNSMRHRYLRGIYQGIPEVGYLDLNELVQETMEKSYLKGNHDER